jgi:hypothetical protein
VSSVRRHRCRRTVYSCPRCQCACARLFPPRCDRFGAALEFITDKSQEGNQFCKGFGGVGAILQWKVDFAGLQPDAAKAKNAAGDDDVDVEDFDFDEYDAATGYEDDFI